MEIIGWIGSVLFAICGLPQAIQSYNEGHSDGLNWLFILPWLFGELFTLIYIIPKGDMPLIFNYVLNLVFLLVILYYKIKPRK
ncbi:COG4095 Uncharacterized conserved protein [uncultured Caudovirales phage]|uniref:COG4095 Uncharacterized conserved protein n=1 Tax=uncultured Caudovirales phage TaxID=2100421 RepID=A0A6J5PXU8_9CAUD|nr:COG4095 Uncharacterized conserved protein [uncultured Caudovirales phage]CAB4185190.1 COG4095 Uncharacterized conserved protein [uncultured Caudovirales phage]CAB4193636.1 COG4095 Uncharacterized conserved protein [uncultured Caudovirales phage]CAB4215871.1 COG4095 Uncharacterized conserved protein [uncultured Caudovirales phage]CAB5230650.1 COG4095 Uncharacterized conserved protein [uncultured Caudovirales phage]